MKRLLALFFLMIFLGACDSDHVPSGIIGEKEMIKILADIHLADGYSSVNYADSTGGKTRALYLSVYKKCGTDSAEVRKSVNYYMSHPDKLQAMYEKINARLQELQTKEQQIEDLEFRKRDARFRDSVQYQEQLRDTLSKGFIIGPMPDFSLQKYAPAVLPVTKPVTPVPVPAAPAPAKSDTLRRPGPAGKGRPLRLTPLGNKR